MANLLKELRKSYLVEREGDRYYTENEIAKMSPPSEHNANTICKVKNVIFDQINGMGATPYNQDVFYFGFVVLMTPHNFLRVAAHGGDDRVMTGKKLIAEINKGRSLGSPFLEIDGRLLSEDGDIAVHGHEGRARCNAMIEMGLADDLIPVHIITAPVRARNIDETMVRRFANKMVSETTHLKRPNMFKTFYLNNTEYQV
jgi:hypothetical protein